MFSVPHSDICLTRWPIVIDLGPQLPVFINDLHHTTTPHILPLNRSQPLLSHYAPVKRSSSLSLAENFKKKNKRRGIFILSSMRLSLWLTLPPPTERRHKVPICRSMLELYFFLFFFIASLQLKVHIHHG